MKVTYLSYFSDKFEKYQSQNLTAGNFNFSLNDFKNYFPNFGYSFQLLPLCESGNKILQKG